MMRRTPVGICLVTFGCGGAAGANAVASGAPRSGASPSIEALAQSGSVQTASEEVRRYWPFGDDFDFGVYLQSDGTRGADIVSRWVPTLLELAKNAVPLNKRACASELLGSMRELAVGSTEADHVIVFRFDVSQVKSDAIFCLQGLFGGEPTKLAGFRAQRTKPVKRSWL